MHLLINRGDRPPGNRSSCIVDTHIQAIHINLLHCAVFHELVRPFETGYYSAQYQKQGREYLQIMIWHVILSGEVQITRS